MCGILKVRLRQLHTSLTCNTSPHFDPILRCNSIATTQTLIRYSGAIFWYGAIPAQALVQYYGAAKPALWTRVSGAKLLWCSNNPYFQYSCATVLQQYHIDTIRCNISPQFGAILWCSQTWCNTVKVHTVKVQFGGHYK